MAECIGQTLERAYAHHIQRLMITGNFALIAGVQPSEVDAWYLAVYADAVEWVTLPNTHGMVMHADGGVVGSKPYAASGKYIQRMSDYCRGCRYSPAERTGPRACPFNVFYWDFLLRHRERFAGNPRMAMVMRNAARLPEKEQAAIRSQAAALRLEFGITNRSAS
jgi:deoxyribodipyrimidine photolyase-related protein